MNRYHDNKMPLSKLIPLVLFLCIMAWYPRMNPLKDAPQGGYGHPAISDDYPDLDQNQKINQVLDDGSRIYTLSWYGKRLVQVYDMDGNYEKTLFFQSMSNNGQFVIATEEDTLYVQDEKRNVYVFHDGEFVEFLKEDEARKELKHINFNDSHSKSGYIVKNHSVWRVAESGNICIIEGKPLYLRFWEKGWIYVFSLGLMGFLLYMKRRGK